MKTQWFENKRGVLMCQHCAFAWEADNYDADFDGEVFVQCEGFINEVEPEFGRMCLMCYKSVPAPQGKRLPIVITAVRTVARFGRIHKG